MKLPAEGASEAEIDQQIEALRDYYHEFENANANTKVKADSYADLKIAATDENGEDVSALSSESRMCLMGSGMFPAAFDEQVIGLKKGQTARLLRQRRGREGRDSYGLPRGQDQDGEFRGRGSRREKAGAPRAHRRVGQGHAGLRRRRRSARARCRQHQWSRRKTSFRA